jgi:hypothetical protein
MDNFKFYNPVKIVFGRDTISQIGELISQFGFKKVLILYGGGSIKGNGVYNAAVSSLSESGIEFVEFGSVQPNPIVNHAREAVKFAKNNNVDAVLAIGGGSVVDEAKAISAGYYLKDVWNIFEGTETIKKALPLFTILTLSATGSEMNSYGVMTNPEEKKKWSFGSPFSYPLVSIIDPSVQMKLPWRQTINGGVDSLSHIFEQYFAPGHAEPTLAIDEALMRTIIKAVNILQEDELNYTARADLAWSASLALCGLTGVAMKGGEWAVHSIEHAISAFYPEVAHAEGLAVIFPAWMKYVSPDNPERFSRWAKNIFDADTIDGGIDALTNLFRKWKAPTTLRELNIEKSAIPTLAKNAVLRGTLGNSRKIDYNDVVKILEIAY